ncbi:MAG: MFS transporter [Gaiella sp.]
MQLASAVRTHLRESRASIAQVFGNPSLRRIQLAFAASVIGDWANMVAAAVYVYTQSGAFGVGALAVVRYLAVAIVGPFTATLADRLSRTRVMIASDVVRGVLVTAAAVTIAVDGSPWLVYALAVTTAVAGTAFRPAQAALLPRLVRDPAELTAANVVASTIESVGFFAGPALGGLLLAVADIPVVYAFNAATFAVSALLVAAIRPDGAVADEREDHSAAGAGFLGEVAAGFRVIGRDRGVLTLVTVYAAQTVVAGASGVFVVVLALEELGLGKAGVGVLDSILGIGALVGGLVALVLAQRNRLALDFGLGVLLWSVPLLLLAVSPTLPMAVVVFLLIGLGNSIVDINAYTILQRIVSDDVMGRVFGALESVLIATMALGALATPVLIELTGLRTTFLVLGVAVGVLTLLLLPVLSRLDRTALAPAGVALLRGVPFLAPLPDSVVERLARALERVEHPAGSTVITAGEPGDRFYVIEEGEVEILGRSFGPGESFGEIALLRDVPRQATVTATTALVLQALDGPTFVHAVTGHGEASDLAESVMRTRLALR